jgi:RNA polymerase-binding transcription factor DksA
LFTIGTTVLILRIIKKMPKETREKGLPQSLIDSIKNALTKKQEGINKQEKLLEEEDPYMQEGRAVGNSENVDEAYLEDTFKNVIDAQKNVLKTVKGNVKKALSKLSKGEYGKCEKCGVDIDPARLKAYPEAVYCSECARKEEASHTK